MKIVLITYYFGVNLILCSNIPAFAASKILYSTILLCMDFIKVINVIFLFAKYAGM